MTDAKCKKTTFPTHRNVREAMFKILISTRLREEHRGRKVGKTVAPDGWVQAGGHGKKDQKVMDLRVDPSTCIFWCAVAIGGLVQGRPIDMVR